MTSQARSRREVVRLLGLGAAALLTPRLLPAGTRTDSVRIVMVSARGDARLEAAVLGARMGAEEAARAASLLRLDLQFDVAEDERGFAGAAFLVGGAALDDALRTADAATAAGALFLNVACADDALRAACRRGTFHVCASEAMRARAAQLAGGYASVMAWHPTLERYGAAQLNDRFRARYTAEMDEHAWAGWTAVKIAWETSVRARSRHAAALLDHLESARARFDAHKGKPLSFRAEDHQLRQPLYVTAALGGLREVPSAAAEESAAEMLDTLLGDPPCERSAP